MNTTDITAVRIRTSDSRWCDTDARVFEFERNGTNADGAPSYLVTLLVHAVSDVEVTTFAGRQMIRFRLDNPPRDHHASAMYPANDTYAVTS